MKRHPEIAAALMALLAATTGAGQDAAPSTSCIRCHSDASVVGDDLAAIVTAFQKGDAHAAVGLSCQDCHGGNPDPAVGDDMDAAMNPHFAPNPFKGAPSRAETPDFCGRCHSDPSYMRRFKPDMRVDQEREYWTSRHGELLRRGDAHVAVCTSCHGAHGVLGPGEIASPVYAKNVAETCKKCHADATIMASYGIPIDQYARWRQSVHAQGLLDRGDLSAPTCNDCHGNHGAVPPGVESIAFVCGQCHGREATLFRASPKREGFADHVELLAQAGSQGCAACHPAGSPPAALARSVTFSECTTCHGNHGIVRPTVSMLSPLPETPCVFCHIEKLEGVTGRTLEIRRHQLEVRDALLADARTRGLDPEQTFNWLVDEVQKLPFHTTGEAGHLVLRKEFERLFTKFRIGHTYYTFEDPATGKEVRAEVVQCGQCHSPHPQLTDNPVGYTTSATFLARTRELTTATAEAERLLLAAQRGGVPTSDAAGEVDQAVDDQIQVEVLIHSFSVAEGGPFLAKQADGMKHAQSALEDAQKALDQLSFRRRGLVVSLVIILVLLAALAMKIRQLTRSVP